MSSSAYYSSSSLGNAASSSSTAASPSSSIKDRTFEFRSFVSHHRAQLNASNGGNAAAKKAGPSSSTTPLADFTRKASAIGKDISATTIKLGRLAELAKKKSLFDDRPVEISELTYIIKHDLAAINKQLSDLQAQSKMATTKGKAQEHTGNVVTLLQTNLASTTTAFQDVLEVRTQNMKASRDRSEQFAFASGGSGAPNGQQTNSGESRPQACFPRMHCPR